MSIKNKEQFRHAGRPKIHTNITIDQRKDYSDYQHQYYLKVKNPRGDTKMEKRKLHCTVCMGIIEAGTGMRYKGKLIHKSCKDLADKEVR